MLALGYSSILSGYQVDAGVIIGVVLINGLIGFIQEGKAEKAIDAVRNMLSAQATVIRGGRRYQLPAEALVPGDVVFVQSGDRVPADLRLFRLKELRIEEAILTGESVPVTKRADVGVAMGIKGVEAAKEAAEMVLADDNFASIAHAVEEGRTVFDNIKKSILFILPTNGGEALTILAAIALGKMLPVIAAQILWVNMITAVTLALSLVFEPTESDVMRRKPRNISAPMMSGFMTWRILFVSLLMVFGTFGLFLWERLHGAEIEVARTVAVNTLVIAEVFYLLTFHQ